MLLVGLLLPATLLAAEQKQAAEPKKPAEAKKAAEPEKAAAAKKAEAAGAEAVAEPPAHWVEQLVDKCQKSVVVITVEGRDGKQEGLGSGFVVSSDGLIATNLHVIGEARPMRVRMTNGKQFQVTSVEATERSLDLALIRIDAKDLPTLPLGDSDQVRQGQRVVALGNPLGLEHSVVSGVISGSREINGLPLIQLAIPIEPGNSGGPLLDDQGRVLGLLTMKSAVTQNLGFAVKINALKGLLAQPNPIPIARWLTIGTLDVKEWTPLLGGMWRQRAGRISVDGRGAGFGGRSLCISQLAIPGETYELAVMVKLGSEDGAAGLVFASDGGDRHYGFYPSAGKLRLSRFEGPDVLSWNVLSEQPSAHYKPDDWNQLRVRVEPEKITCWVNDQRVFESTDMGLRGGRVGLAKFRETKAEFKQFRLAKELKVAAPPKVLLSQIDSVVDVLAKNELLDDKILDQLARSADQGGTLLEQRAQQLDKQAQRLRELSEVIHRRQVEQQLVAEINKDDDQCDLVRAALLVARLDNAELDIEAYVQEIERMAREMREALPKNADENAKIDAINKYLFAENGFHGSRGDYYNRANSYLNEVIDDREGLPITLSVLYIELAQRLGVKIVGVGAPGHFVVRHLPKSGKPQLIDPYEKGEKLSLDDLAKRIDSESGRKIDEDSLVAVSKRAIVERMLRNLLGNATREEDRSDMLHYLDAIVAISPDAIQERVMRAVMHYRAGNPRLGLRDTQWILDHEPEGVDLERVRELQQALERSELRTEGSNDTK